MRLDIFQAQRENESNEHYLDLNIHRELSKKNPVVKIFKGKALKPYANYYFKTVEKLEEYIAQEKKTAEKRIQSKKDDKENKEKVLADYKIQMKVGNILVCSWGYEQTNIDFYIVQDIKGKFAVIQKIGQAHFTEDQAYMQDDVLPDRSKLVGKPMRKKICLNVYGDRVSECIKLSSFQHLKLWDCQVMHATYYA